MVSWQLVSLPQAVHFYLPLSVMDAHSYAQFPRNSACVCTKQCLCIFQLVHCPLMSNWRRGRFTLSRTHQTYLTNTEHCLPVTTSTTTMARVTTSIHCQLLPSPNTHGSWSMEHTSYKITILTFPLYC